MQRRSLEVVSVAILALVAIVVFYRVYSFGQERFFTVDEYQYAHATWLVSEGERPYVDFYEHHFPLSYVAHAPLVWPDGAFAEKVLRLRALVFGYLLGVSLLLGWATWCRTRDRCASLLALAFPAAFGFSLMSAVDYRADNFGAYLFVGGWCLLDANRAESGKRGFAVLAGVALGLAVLMTQKMLFVAGASALLALAYDRFRAGRSHGTESALVVFPAWFCLGVALPLVFALVLGAAAGILSQAWEITILQAIEHEVFYPAVSWSQYAGPFFRETPVSSVLVLLAAILFFVLGRSVFWAIALGVVLLGGTLLKAQYPYNYVLLCLLVAFCAVRGWALLVQRWQPAGALLNRAKPLFYLFPVLLIPDQLGFVAHATSNEHQLAILSKIERFSGDSDVVIDNSGGALFRPHGSYYYQHGDAHRDMFSDYFEHQLVEDYRRSQGLLWIIDYRLLDLPPSVHQYFLDHYVRVDGSLFALGFQTPRTHEVPLLVEREVIRPGDYFVFPAPVRLRAESRNKRSEDREFDLEIDGVPVTTQKIRLDEGIHRIEVLPDAPAYFVTAVSPEAFLLSEEDRFARELDGAKAYQLLFEYDPKPNPAGPRASRRRSLMR